MKQTWRWFGPADPIDIYDLPQVGVQGVVTSLHHIPPGTPWTKSEIRQRQAEIAKPTPQPTGLNWDVVESLPVSEVIKTKGTGYAAHIAAYKESLHNLAGCGIQTVCYNFMPVLDWTRTNLAARMPHGGTAMAFDVVDFALFDLFLLARPSAEDDHSPDIRQAASARFNAMDDTAHASLVNTVVSGLPGANDSWTLADVMTLLDLYKDIDTNQLRANLIDFLSEVVPVAEEHGIRLCCHPDDPPFSLLGLPRVMSTTADYEAVLSAIDSPANGATLCTGSLGVNPEFDIAKFVQRLGSRIHFAHLRNTLRQGPADGDKISFHESMHLEGETDMVVAIRALLQEESRRKSQGRTDWEIPMRPDHGQNILHDLHGDSLPGYPLIGRTRGLAELRGVMAALTANL
ncbi:mannonate dehydratase [Shimia sagamensis]|uniref:Mannonate dehydratase n=1 Tax=Shimia sagamensis TaxID=1566352 RepID=A0ABY1NY60_9RHOB|nr:mannonate dehydratase [Shimia sagamensis]SMP20359.1 D-mannonate dehydratase [Shimia sagamensis]